MHAGMAAVWSFWGWLVLGSSLLWAADYHPKPKGKDPAAKAKDELKAAQDRFAGLGGKAAHRHREIEATQPRCAAQVQASGPGGRSAPVIEGPASRSNRTGRSWTSPAARCWRNCGPRRSTAKRSPNAIGCGPN